MAWCQWKISTMKIEGLLSKLETYKKNLYFIECHYGYFGSGTNCTLCPSGTIKPWKGDATNCTGCVPNSQSNVHRTNCCKLQTDLSITKYGYKIQNMVQNARIVKY